MPGWFEENVEGYQPGGGEWHGDLGAYGEAGGFAGPVNGPLVTNQGQPAGETPQAFNAGQQVGHDGTINGMNREQYRDAWMSSGVNSVAGMKDWIAKNGGTWMADNGTVMTPFGEALDMGFNARGSAAGNGQLRPTWGGGGGPAGGPGGGGPPVDFGAWANSGGGGGGFNGFGGFNGGGGGGGYQGDPYTYQDIDAPTDYTPTDVAGPNQYTPERVSTPDALQATDIARADAFKAPTAEDMYADPGVQVRLDRGAKAFMANKAAQGVARTGGALKQLADYNQDSVSQEYGNVYNRRFGEYTTGLQDRFNVGQANNANRAQAYGLSNQYRQNAEMANQNAGFNAWNAYQGMNQQNQQFNAGRRDQAAQQNFANRFGVAQANNAGRLAGYQANANTALGFTNAANQRDIGMGNIGLGYHQANQSYDLGLRNNALGYYSAGNSYALGNAANQLGWANYGLNAQGQGFNQAYSLANLGLNAAGMYGNYAGNYGQNSANNATGVGNAQAGGMVGSANAWNQGLGGAYNAALGAYGAYQGRQRGGGLYLDPSEGQRV